MNLTGFKRFINSTRPRSILLPAEGDAQNVVYAASEGWKVEAFDFGEGVFCNGNASVFRFVGQKL